MNTHKKSVSLGDMGKYRTEVFQNLATKYMNQHDLMTVILDYIRNYREIPEDMLNKISFMTEDKKMDIIREFNRIIGIIQNIIE